MAAKDCTQTIDKITVDYLSFTDLEIGKNSKSKQYIAYPRYNHPKYNNMPLFIQFPWIELSTYGIPKLGDFIKEDSQRLYIKVPLDTIKHADLINFLNNIDNHFGSEKFKNDYLGKFITSKSKCDKYKYNTLLKYPQNDSDDEGSGNEKKVKKDKPQRPPYIKIKIDTDYNSGEIKTIIYDTTVEPSSDDDNNYNVISRNKFENIKTISDCADKIRWKTIIRPVIRIVKLWCLDAKTPDPKYGITVKAAKIDVIKSNNENNSMYKSYMEDDDTFIDSKEVKSGFVTDVKKVVKEKVETKPKPVEKKPEVKQNIVDLKSDNSESESDDSPVNNKTNLDSDGSDSDQEPSKTNLDSDSEEEIKPASTPVAKSKKGGGKK